jgi:hypothetical protein
LYPAEPIFGGAAAKERDSMNAFSAGMAPAGIALAADAPEVAPVGIAPAGGAPAVRSAEANRPATCSFADRVARLSVNTYRQQCPKAVLEVCKHPHHHPYCPIYYFFHFAFKSTNLIHPHSLLDLVLCL